MNALDRRTLLVVGAELLVLSSRLTEERGKSTPMLEKIAVMVVTSSADRPQIYSEGTRFLQFSEATFLNLSMQTVSLWAVVFSVAAQQIVPRPLFFVSLVATVRYVWIAGGFFAGRGTVFDSFIFSIVKWCLCL